MSYEVRLLRRAERQLDALPPRLRARVARRLQDLQQSARPPGAAKLSGQNGYRLRIGDYRVLYEVNDELEVVTIVAVGHRREVYR